MAIFGQYFPGQAPTERVFLVLRRSFITYISFLIIALIMSIPLFVLAALLLRYPDLFVNETINELITLGGSAYLLFILALLLYGFVDYYLDVYILTDERIVDIKQTGFFKREISELHLREVQDVSAQVKGFFPTMFHYGNIFIQTAAERENFIFYAVHHPYRVSKKIADLHENQIERDRLRIEETLLRAGRPQIGSVQAEQQTEQVITPSISETNQNLQIPQQVNQVPNAEQYIDKGMDNSSNFKPLSKTDLTGNATSAINPTGEHYSERGIPDESEQGVLKESPIPTNITKGLEDIDSFIAETEKEAEAIDPGHSKELKEGEVEDIYDD